MSRQLKRHPEIWFGRKELHFFDKGINEVKSRFLPKEMAAKLRYGLYFAEGRIKRERLVGEFTPAYAVLSKESIAQVHSWAPDVKLLYIMRDPVERAWSHARKHFKDKRGKSVSEATVEELCTFLEHPNIRKRGDYLWCLENWLTYYSRDQLFIAFLEDVKVDAERVLKDTFRFLGVDPNIQLNHDDLTRARNPRPQSTMPGWLNDYLREMFYRDVEELEAICGRKVSWSDAAREFNDDVDVERDLAMAN